MSTPPPATGVSATGVLNSHRLLTFAGKDATTFLQGYLTNDTAKLSTTQAQPSAFTNLKGRVVANGWVWGDATTVHMLVAESLTETVAEFLKPYMNFSRTKLTIAAEPPAVHIGASGSLDEPLAVIDSHRALLSNSGISNSGISNSGISKEDLSSDWLSLCIAAKEAVITAPCSGIYLPQMLGLTEIGAVSFDKGCYLGQEVVARAQHRGEVKRRLQRATYQIASGSAAESQELLQAGDVLTNREGKRMGNVICATTNNLLLVSSEDPTSMQHVLHAEQEIELSFAGA